MSGEVQRCGAGVYFLLQSGTAVVMLVVQLGIAFALAPLLTGVALLMLGAGALLLGRLLGRSNLAGQRVSAANQSVLDEVARFLSGMKVAMSQNLEESFVAAFSRNLGIAAGEQIRFMQQQSLMRGRLEPAGSAGGHHRGSGGLRLAGIVRPRPADAARGARAGERAGGADPARSPADRLQPARLGGGAQPVR